MNRLELKITENGRSSKAWSSGYYKQSGGFFRIKNNLLATSGVPYVTGEKQYPG